MDNLVKFYAIRIYNETQYNEIIQLLYFYGFRWSSGTNMDYSNVLDLDWLFFTFIDKTIVYSSEDFKFTKIDFQIFPEECEPLLKLKSIL